MRLSADTAVTGHVGCFNIGTYFFARFVRRFVGIGTAAGVVDFFDVFGGGVSSSAVGRAGFDILAWVYLASGEWLGGLL